MVSKNIYKKCLKSNTAALCSLWLHFFSLESFSFEF
jgi:hypothetical protein